MIKIIRSRTTGSVTLLLIKIWFVGLAFVGVFVLGQYSNQQAIEQRVLDIDTHCYNELQLEYIIFGAIQE
jgi:FlaG/FlaF family flagellin (archaellin)